MQVVEISAHCGFLDFGYLVCAPIAAHEERNRRVSGLLRESSSPSFATRKRAHKAQAFIEQDDRPRPRFVDLEFVDRDLLIYKRPRKLGIVRV